VALLSRQTVQSILEGKGDGRVPIWYNYFADETRKRYGERINEILNLYPDDFIVLTRADEEWGTITVHADGGVGSLPNQVILSEWDELDGFLKDILEGKIEECNLRPYALEQWKMRKNRYVVGHWWYGYSENLSLLRGPLDALTDVLLEEENVNLLFDALEKYFFQLVRTFRTTYDADAIWLGDDYGMQDRSMYSPDVFRSLFKPRLRALADNVHSQGMKLFLHSCGNVEQLLPDIIEAGIDLIHPIQPGVMDARRIVREYGNDIGFFIGMDAQNILSSGSVADVSCHVDELFDIFRDAKRGVLASMSNTIMPDTPWANIEALFTALQRNGSLIS